MKTYTFNWMVYFSKWEEMKKEERKTENGGASVK